MSLSNIFFIQIDITNDKRYSLSKSSLTKLKKIDEPLIIDIFLEGDIPETYIPFRNELDAILNRLKYYNSNIIVKYIPNLIILFICSIYVIFDVGKNFKKFRSVKKPLISLNHIFSSIYFLLYIIFIFY